MTWLTKLQLQNKSIQINLNMTKCLEVCLEFHNNEFKTKTFFHISRLKHILGLNTQLQGKSLTIIIHMEMFESRRKTVFLTCNLPELSYDLCWLQTHAWCSIQRLQRFLVNPSIRTDKKREESGPKIYKGKDDYLKKNTEKRFVGLLLNSCLASQLFLVSPDPLNIPTQPIPNSVRGPAPCLNQKMSYMKLKYLRKHCICNSDNRRVCSYSQ